MGVGSNSSKLFVVDLGLVKRYLNPTTKEHIPYIDGLKLTGTARFASVRALSGSEQSRRDDLESLGYVLLYLLKGSLPWQGISATDKYQKIKLIGEMKASIPVNELCSGLPPPFVEFFNYVKKLEFHETPNYLFLHGLFRSLFEQNNFKNDGWYDWMALDSSFASQVPQEVKKRPKNDDYHSDAATNGGTTLTFEYSSGADKNRRSSASLASVLSPEKRNSRDIPSPIVFEDDMPIGSIPPPKFLSIQTSKAQPPTK